MRNAPKNVTSQWKGILGMSFCTFSGQCEPFRLFKRPIQTMIMIGKNRFRAKNLPKNGTSHWSHIRRILFRIFSAPYRLFRSSCTGLIAGNYDMLEEVPRWYPSKNGTSHWTSLLGIFFCTFSGKYRNSRYFRTSLVTENYDMLEKVLGGNPPKNGTSHCRRIRKILFCTFSALYRFFSSLLYGPHSRKLWYVGRDSTLKSFEKWYFPYEAHTKNIHFQPGIGFFVLPARAL